MNGNIIIDQAFHHPQVAHLSFDTVLQLRQGMSFPCGLCALSRHELAELARTSADPPQVGTDSTPSPTSSQRLRAFRNSQRHPPGSLARVASRSFRRPQLGRKVVAAVVFLLLGLFGPLAQAQRIPIERAQRAFQARYTLIHTNQFVNWPASLRGPAPQFPPDGFYEDVTANPDRAVALVQDLWRAIEAWHLEDSFADTPDGFTNIEHEQSLSRFSNGGFPDPDSINRSNYAAMFQSADDLLNQLNYLFYTGGLPAIYERVGYGESTLNASNALAQAAANWNNDNFTYEPALSDCGTYYQTLLDGNTWQALYVTHAGSGYWDFSHWDARPECILSYIKPEPQIDGFDGYVMGWCPYTYGELDRYNFEAPAYAGVVDISSFANGRPDYSYDPESVFTNYVQTIGWQVWYVLLLVKPSLQLDPDPISYQNCSCALGTLSVKGKGAGFQISLGKMPNGKAAGYLLAQRMKRVDELSQPNSLRWCLSDGLVAGTNSLGVLTNLVLPQGEVSVENVGATNYCLAFYYPGRTACFKRIWISGDPIYYHNFQLTETDPNGATNYFANFTYNYTLQQLELHYANGVGVEQVQSAWDTYNQFRTDTRIQKNQADQPIRQTIETWQSCPWGMELVQRVQGTGANALTNSWTYNTNQYLPEYRQLSQRIGSSGKWERYSYDDLGRLINTVTQFGSGPPNAPESDHWAVQTVYNTTNANYTTITKLKGHEVARQERVFTDTETQIKQYDGSRILTNIIQLNPLTNAFPGEVKRVQHPDGTVELYSYATNGANYTVTVLAGQPDGTGTNLVKGTKTVTTRGSIGQILSVQTQATTNGSTWLTIAQETHLSDPLGRSTNITYLDGTQLQRTYNCCDLESETSREGVLHTWLYDELNRPYIENQFVNGQQFISTVKTLDVAGQVLAVTRVGTNGNNIVLGQSAYDLAGRVTWETNALNGPTSHTDGYDANGFLTRTSVFPDGGMKIERYNPDGTLDRLTGTAVHPVRYEYGVEDVGGSVWQTYTKEIKLDVSYQDTAEWTKTYRDSLGRVCKVAYPGGGSKTSIYNAQAQLQQETDPDGVTTLYEYNGLGELEYTTLDSNRDGVRSDTFDRITQTVREYGTSQGYTVQRNSTYVWPEYGSSAKIPDSVKETTLNAANSTISWQTSYGQTVTTLETFNGGGSRTVRITAPDGSYTLAQYQNGRQLNAGSYASDARQLGLTTYTYDQHGRTLTSTDARNGTTTYAYNNADQVTSVTTPIPMGGQSAQTTVTDYDTSGRAWRITNPDNTTVTNEYYFTGALKKTSGSRTYPVQYTYDGQGRMQTLTTWRDPANPSTAAVTTWNYDALGLLSAKLYASGPGLVYSNTLAGRLKERTGERGIKTVYTYTNAEVALITYTDGGATPSVNYTYDRRGRLRTVTRNNIITTLSYLDSGQLLEESYSGGTLNGLKVANHYDSLLRRTNVQAAITSPSTVLANGNYAYDPTCSRLQTVSDGSSAISYTYYANSPLIFQIDHVRNGVERLRVQRNYDFLNRLLSTVSTDGGTGVLDSYAYTYNNANQRTRVDLSDASYWLYLYDALGQIQSAKKYWPDNVPVAGQQFEYAHDSIGNRTQAKAGGDSSGGSLRTANYTANALNQYTQRDVPGAVDILGTADPGQTVTVNGQATYRKGAYFQIPLAINNATIPAYAMAEVQATQSGTNAAGQSGHVFLAQTPEPFHYDADGNLTNDGHWNYTWDAENRLVSMETISLVPSEAKRKLVFEYDWQGRRIRKQVSDWDANSSSYLPASTSLFLYDSWNLLVELTSDLRPLTSFLWGLDLSGTLQGAGGIGGLLQFTHHSSPITYHFVSYDGNGNVTTLIEATTGNVSARYEYGPFGEPIRMTGLQSRANCFRWSTKYADEETDLVYYGYRYYSPTTGRWLNRDGKGETGGVNIYGFVRNNGVNGVDPFGQDYLDDWEAAMTAAFDQADALQGRISGIFGDIFNLRNKYIAEPTAFNYSLYRRNCNQAALRNHLFQGLGQQIAANYGGYGYLASYDAYAGLYSSYCTLGPPVEPKAMTDDEFQDLILGLVGSRGALWGYAYDEETLEQHKQIMANASAEIHNDLFYLSLADPTGLASLAEAGLFWLEDNKSAAVAASGVLVVGAKYARGGARIVKMGRDGEAAVGITKTTKITEHIPSLTRTAEYRVPDVLDHVAKVIGDVKNVAYQDLSYQIIDELLYAQQRGYDFVLVVRQTTRLSEPLINALALSKATINLLPW